jgi:hypothetical protein
MLAALGLAEAVPAAIDRLRSARGLEPLRLQLTTGNAMNGVVLGLVLLSFIASSLNNFRLINTSLVPPEPQRAFEWARLHTPSDSRFVLLTGQESALIDPLQEWFPALAGRRSQSTVQGLEWTIGDGFFPRLRALASLQQCRTIECVERWSESTGLGYTHVLLKSGGALDDLAAALDSDAGYRRVYENAEIVIYAAQRR